MGQSDFTRYKYPHHLARSGDDWLIRYRGGRPLARVILDQRTIPKRWSWMTWTDPHDKGVTDTLDAALEAVKAAILALPADQRVRPLSPGDRLRRGDYYR
ncbi:hypothetical protein [Yoonia sp. SDW83-1]|uniref:hypothetical protein n=1 Tax=Yoonia sp. SDW83-1 TaxID=3366945 RepID=UPI00398C45D3